MNASQQYTARPLLAADAPHVARIDAMQSDNAMSAKQILKMNAKQHIIGLVVENSEGVIVAWCLRMNCGDWIDVLRIQRHIEFDCDDAITSIVKQLKNRLSPKYTRISAASSDSMVRDILISGGFVTSTDDDVLTYGR